MLLVGLLVVPVAFGCNLTWEHPEPETVDGYTLYWQYKNAGVEQVLGTIGMPCPFETTGKGATWVTAYNNFGESEPSNRLPFGVPESADAFRFE